MIHLHKPFTHCLIYKNYTPVVYVGMHKPLNTPLNGMMINNDKLF